MAKSKEPLLTLDYRQIAAIPIGPRQALRSSLGDIIASDLTPAQRASLFPKAYRAIFSKDDEEAYNYESPSHADSGMLKRKLPPDITKRIPGGDDVHVGGDYKPEKKAIRPATGFIAPGDAGAKVVAEGPFKERKGMMKNVYNAFINNGFSPAQAKALTAEVGRENSFNENLIFGSHDDPYNKVRNSGIFSWQKERNTELMKFLADEGVLDENGRMIRDQKTLNAMAKFAKHEMETKSEYQKTKDEFLANPNIDSESAARILGKDYIKWRIDDARYAHHTNYRRSYYDQIDKIVSEETETATATPLSMEEWGRQYNSGDLAPTPENVQKYEEYKSQDGPKNKYAEIESSYNRYKETQPKLKDVPTATPVKETAATESIRVNEHQQEVAAKRRLPIKQGLRNALEYAADQSGVYVDVTSGGQTKHGPRTGSHRHDVDTEGTIGAADVNLYVMEGGVKRTLDPRVEADRQQIATFTREFARVVPEAGVGAEYMRDPTKIHFGGPNEPGDPAVAYSGAEWFKQAHAEGLSAGREDKKQGTYVLADWLEKKATKIADAEKIAPTETAGTIPTPTEAEATPVSLTSNPESEINAPPSIVSPSGETVEQGLADLSSMSQMLPPSPVIKTPAEVLDIKNEPQKKAEPKPVETSPVVQQTIEPKKEKQESSVKMASMSVPKQEPLSLTPGMIPPPTGSASKAFNSSKFLDDTPIFGP